MDVQTGLVYVGVVVISAVVILLVSMFGIKEKSYEEAIAEQRKLPHDLLLGKKDKGKEKKPKNKTGKKVKEKKEEKDEKDEKEEKPEHVQFEENPQILPVEPLLRKENLHQLSQSESVPNKSPKETPTKSKKNAKDSGKQKDDNAKEEKKEERKDVANLNTPTVATKESGKESNKESGKDGKDTKDGKDVKDSKEMKDSKDQQKETPVRDVKEASKESAPSNQTSNKDSKKTKKKNDILAQIGGEKDAVDISLLMLFIQKAELSRSEIQILIDQLLNKQLDNPSEHSEWSEGRADPVIKLKKQLAEKEKALADEHEASIAFQNKLKELRAELTTEKSRLTANIRQLEKTLETKVTEVQTLHTRTQHILESHAAEKQGYARQIEQLQSKVNEEAAIIHKMQEDQGQTQGHLQQELIAQRKQMEVQFAQMQENEDALKAQLAQKDAEVQKLQNELVTTRNDLTHELDVLRNQNYILEDDVREMEERALHFMNANNHLQDVARQLEEARRAESDLEHRLKSAHHHEQELQKQVNSLQAELNVAKTEPNEESTALKNELSKAQADIMKLKTELSASQAEIMKLKTELSLPPADIMKLKTELTASQAETMKLKTELSASLNEATEKTAEITRLNTNLNSVCEEFGQYIQEYKILDIELGRANYFAEDLRHQREKAKDGINLIREKMVKALDDLEHAQIQAVNCQASSENSFRDCEFEKETGCLQPLESVANRIINEMRILKTELNRVQGNLETSAELETEVVRLQVENGKLSEAANTVPELLKEIKQLQDKNKSLSCKLSTSPSRDDNHQENGIEKKTQDTVNVVDEQANLMGQQITTLKNDLTNKEEQLSQAVAKVNALKNDVDAQHDLARRLQEDLETQKLKNNEIAQQVRLEQEELTKAFLQRIFPEITESELSQTQWLNTVEEKVQAVLTELRRKATIESHPDLIKQNKNLQDMVLHYKQIIEDTESILHKLQNHVESEETRWQSQLQQKENEITSLRAEVSDLIEKLEEMERLQILVTTLQQKIQDLETRLTETKSHLEQTNSELSELRSKAKIVFPEVSGSDLAAFEKLQEEKTRLSEELKTEASKRATLDAELLKLRSLVETSESSLTQEKCLVSQLQQEVMQLKSDMSGGCSSSEQSMLNGPPTSDSPKSEGGSGKK